MLLPLLFGHTFINIDINLGAAGWFSCMCAKAIKKRPEIDNGMRGLFLENNPGHYFHSV